MRWARPFALIALLMVAQLGSATAENLNALKSYVRSNPGKLSRLRDLLAAPTRRPDKPRSPKKAALRAILPDGRKVKPDNHRGGFHGTTLVDPSVALKQGLPRRGDDRRLKEHAEQKGCSAFRGCTLVPSDPASGNGAAYWAGKGGWVYEIRGVPSWDVNSQLVGRVKGAGGAYRGNLMSGENEIAVPAEVPPQRIKAYGKVEQGRSGRLFVKTWIENPAYEPR